VTNIYSNFVDIALSYQGAPYIWGGKGVRVFKDGKLEEHKFTEMDNMHKLINVYDCSGLITSALYFASHGEIDLRGTHSAKTILDTFPECAPDFGDGCLLLYNGHVAADVGRGRVVDANRGDSTCTTPLHAQERNARVEVHRTIRLQSSLLGYRRIPVDKSELKAV
jgi:cell wall-associated NlpC family hydrolase